MKLRRPHLNRYRRQLRDALMDPSLSHERRAEIKEKLASIGLPKVYAGNPSPVPGTTSAKTTLEDLLALTHSELLAKASEEGVEAFKSWTKARIAQAILDNKQP